MDLQCTENVFSKYNLGITVWTAAPQMKLWTLIQRCESKELLQWVLSFFSMLWLLHVYCAPRSFSPFTYRALKCLLKSTVALKVTETKIYFKKYDCNSVFCGAFVTWIKTYIVRERVNPNFTKVPQMLDISKAKVSLQWFYSSVTGARRFVIVLGF